jgi:glycine cleavage system protein P-like pyridoxal-binding family
MVREYALNKMIDVQTAIEELKNLAVYCDLLKVISEQHELQNLELVIQEKKAAVATVTTLRKSGIYEREILEVAETIRKSNSRSEPDSSQQADNN